MMCAVEGCPMPAPTPHVTAFCTGHRRAFGHAVVSSAPWTAGARTRTEVEERVWRRLGEPRLGAGCWVWPGDLSEGYPVVRGETGWAWVDEVVAGATTPRHVCGVAACVNPKHLINDEEK